MRLPVRVTAVFPVLLALGLRAARWASAASIYAMVLLILAALMDAAGLRGPVRAVLLVSLPAATAYLVDRRLFWVRGSEARWGLLRCLYGEAGPWLLEVSAPVVAVWRGVAAICGFRPPRPPRPAEPPVGKCLAVGVRDQAVNSVVLLLGRWVLFGCGLPPRDWGRVFGGGANVMLEVLREARRVGVGSGLPGRCVVVADRDEVAWLVDAYSPDVVLDLAGVLGGDVGVPRRGLGGVARAVREMGISIDGPPESVLGLLCPETGVCRVVDGPALLVGVPRRGVELVVRAVAGLRVAVVGVELLGEDFFTILATRGWVLGVALTASKGVVEMGRSVGCLGATPRGPPVPGVPRPGEGRVAAVVGDSLVYVRLGGQG